MSNNLSVLIVDDDINLADSLSDILEAKGYNVRCAGSGEEALSLIKENIFDVVFLDIKMPGMNGVETLKRISEISPTIEIIMITAYAEDELVNQAKKQGALWVLPKPIDIDKVISFLIKLRDEHVLFLVDDDVPFCDSLKDALTINHFEVSSANNAADAVELLSKQKCGIVMLDMKLNGKSGLEVAKTIKERGCKCTIVLMSAYAKEFQSQIDEALKAHIAQSIIEKPFEIDHLIIFLEELSREKLKEALK